MGFHIDFCTNVMSALVMSSLPLLCADLRFGLPPASPLPQSPIHRSFSLLLDFLTSPLRFKVQSAALSRPFWTSPCLPSISKSNPPLFLAPFGLPRISPLPQSPICHLKCTPYSGHAYTKLFTKILGVPILETPTLYPYT